MREAPGTEGLRERKKRLTRRHISDIATGLFMERGFGEVTIAEIAQTADVSVNTIYNYFPAKEDLLFDRHAEAVERLSLLVRARRPGESVARAVLRTLREELAVRSMNLFTADCNRFRRVVMNSPALQARLWRMQLLAVDSLARTCGRRPARRPRTRCPS
jgi:AcrR family transcriptional regulator